MEIDHDRLFKELISTFFLEFLELFLPELRSTIDPNSIRFLQQEYFADLTAGEEKIIDLLVEVKQSGEDAAFLVHVEAQSTPKSNFTRRIFFYFSRLHQKFLQRIYPIVVFSFDKPYREEPSTYTIEFPNRKILEFNFESIQLNRLNWRHFIDQPNPVAAALMSKMRIAPEDRVRVKVECLRLLVTLRLDPARTKLISGFVDTYLKLNATETQAFQTEISRIEPERREGIMQIVTSWMQEGIEQGIEQGIERERSLVLRLLTKQVGSLPPEILDRCDRLSIDQIETLGEALLEFTSLADLEAWLIQA
ncbi:Rpn family recombination-promoting nuclease/putative transposase [Leptolyngbya sp. AN03gr2]|uniref:Rpn family recombination-promoting nuclease/putative transposase n=1 Tax=unclassified Leptolyngbya TaxID=2650499 RepID=UPI003D320031